MLLFTKRAKRVNRSFKKSKRAITLFCQKTIDSQEKPKNEFPTPCSAATLLSLLAYQLIPYALVRAVCKGNILCLIWVRSNLLLEQFRYCFPLLTLREIVFLLIFIQIVQEFSVYQIYYCSNFDFAIAFLH